ncbi:MAG: NusG domain II-containing protein [Lachnospiraceae bacterium]|nr:NusG domain II-containing protein [Lachnospiraceae bacterium]
MRKLTTPSKIAIGLSVLLFFLLALSALWIWLAPKAGQDPMVAEVYQDGAFLRRISLSEVKAPYQFTVKGKDGCENVIEVRPGSIAIVSASCPDKLCVHMGLRSDSLLPIVCLPNHLVIRLHRESDEEETDAITY